ncbi:ABC transporter ATP-binding protein [Ornithinibacillus salinisoli]|uniref:ABC transporter ATP-binding protein n=1 Tax=Ornithinibacillus salinisoli TaxID=1848459 RepID=A0ABW4VZ47_9BACI
MRRIPLNRSEKPLLHVDQFAFAYENVKEKPVLNNISFTLYENEVTLLMGASGSGKSTISLCLNGLYPEAVEGFTKGNIYFEGINISEFSKGELNQQVGIVFQDPESQFCMITVEDELAFTLENINIPASEMPQRISEVLQAVGMESFGKEKFHQLSGGQKQKIALAAVLLLEPKLLILDEPTANLDPVSSMEFIQLIHRIKQERGLSVFIIEHQADDWMDMINRVMILGHDGNIVADDQRDVIFKDKKQLLEREGIFLPRSHHESFWDVNTGSTTFSNQEVCLSVQNVTFKRKKNVILEGINLTIQSGEFMAIIGENGAGKSTLLQLIAGLLKAEQGKIELFGKPISKWKENYLRKRIGYVFQNPEHQFITDTVYDEITFGYQLNGYAQMDMDEKALHLLKQFQLENQKFSNPFSLSGGQKRRLSVATMLDETPDILLFDEPTFGQDAQSTKELMRMIKELQSSGTAVVFVTHNMDLVDAYCERVIVMLDKKIGFSGSPQELWRQEKILEKSRLRLPYRIRHKVGKGEKYDFVH